MKARTIARRIAVGLLSTSLLLSSTPIKASQTEEVSGPDAGAEDSGSMAPAKEPDSLETDVQNPENANGSSDSDLDLDQTTESNAGATGEVGVVPDAGATDEPDADSQEPDAGNEAEPAEPDTEPGTDLEESDAGNETESVDPDIEPDADSQEPDAEADSEKTDEEEPEEEPDTQQGFLLENLQTVGGDIRLDGDLSDWAMVMPRASVESWVNEWKVACSADGQMLYFAYTGSARTEWDYEFGSAARAFEFQYADGQTDRDSRISVEAGIGSATVKDSYYGDIPGADAVVVNQAHGNNAGPYMVEFAVPVSFFHSSDFTLSFAGTVIDAQEIEQINGDALVPSEPPVYAGISIDGSYADWDAVTKTAASCPNESHSGCVSEVAAIYDGDWFYLYIKDGEGSNASSAGTHSNGKFAIYSDLGYESDIQLSTTPSVSGVDGAKVAYVGREWEIAIPKDQLPKYEESLSFGFYLGDVLIENIVNLQDDSDNNLENLFNGVICDGQYEDWEDYGHTTIEYDTPGSQEAHIDAKGALYSSGETLFGHVVTDAPDHLAEAGGEFIKGVTVAFNQNLADLQSGNINRDLTFYCMFVTVDAAGNIDWNPQQEGYAEGTYKFAIASTDAWASSTNVNNLHEMDQLYGDMYMTIGKNGVDEMEFCLNLPMIAKKLGLDKTDLKQIAAQFIRIGNQWIYTAGTSTAPFAGVALSVVTVGLVLWKRKRKCPTMEWVPMGV